LILVSRRTGDCSRIAAIAAALNRLDLAAKLSGTAAGWRESYQQEQWFPMPNDFHESAARVRRRLGEGAWFEAYEAGMKLSSEQAMNFAMTLYLRWRKSYNAGLRA